MLAIVFLVVIVGATDRRAPAGFALIAVALCLKLIHPIDTPVINHSVSPAPSRGMVGFVSAEPWLSSGCLPRPHRGRVPRQSGLPADHRCPEGLTVDTTEVEDRARDRAPTWVATPVARAGQLHMAGAPEAHGRLRAGRGPVAARAR